MLRHLISMTYFYIYFNQFSNLLECYEETTVRRPAAATHTHTHTPSMQNLAGSALFLPQGGTHFQLVPLAGWNSKIPGRYSNHGSQKFFETGLGSQTQFKNNIAS